MNENIVERWSRAPWVSERRMDTAEAFIQPPALNKRIREYFKDAKKPVDGGSWLGRPEFPTCGEVLDTDTHSSGSSDFVELIPNKPKGAWESKDAFLGALYELEREDGVLPSRHAVSQLRINHTANEDAFNGTIGIYEKVRICEIVFSNRGIALRVTFSLRRAGKRIRWEQSKRLLSGSLVVLTPADDMFQKKAIVATIAARPLQGVLQNPPEIDLFIADPNELEIDPEQEYVMVEGRGGFYEAKRHVLLALQRLMREPFPLQEHLVDVQTEVAPPQYVVDQPYANLTSVLRNNKHETYENVNMLQGWPVQPSSDLDASQLDALRRLLTKRLAICQGPPGTGKTFISVQAIMIMLANHKSGDPPIIIACQTNHAVDQILRHIAAFEPEFARLGGMTKDRNVIKGRTLYELRNATSQPPIAGGLCLSAKRKMKKLEKEIEVLLMPLKPDKTGPLDFRLLEKLNIITAKQADSLEKGASQWVQDDFRDLKEARTSPFFEWLGRSLVTVPYKQEREEFCFEFEEADLPFEQLRELDAENIARDDEMEFEKQLGTQFPISDNFTCYKVPGMTEEKVKNALKQDDLWKIPAAMRPAVYRHLQSELKRTIVPSFREKAKAYNMLATDRRISQWEQDEILLKGQKIIGMTTTGLSKYRGLISALQPKIVLIEEAAETLEAPVTAACMPSLQHLILVGDHKQLRPHTQVRAHENKPFFLNVSLFERMVNNEVEYSELKKQRRMIPEIRRVLYPIYGELIEDHASVLDPRNRSNVPGMGGVNSFFFTHHAVEQRDEHMSVYNAEEVDMIVGFVEYLVYNGVDTNDITVLTFYNGQRKRLLSNLRQRGSLMGIQFKVVTVDSYQGEENRIVILSLVRSNDNGQIGFLDVENRICVALSRAQCGLYIFGNGHLLSQANKTWAKVIKIIGGARRKRDRPKIEPFTRIDKKLPLRCSNHNELTLITAPNDWEDNHGGCQQKCTGRLPCGHLCVLNCHPFAHDRVSCRQECGKPLPCGHGSCETECGQKCSCPVCNKKRARPPPSRLLGSFDEEQPHLRCSTNESWMSFAKEEEMNSDLASASAPLVSFWGSAELGDEERSMHLFDAGPGEMDVDGVVDGCDQMNRINPEVKKRNYEIVGRDKENVVMTAELERDGVGGEISITTRSRKIRVGIPEIEEGMEAAGKSGGRIDWSKMESLLD